MYKRFVLVALVATRLSAQQERAPKPIQDNSFLLEEAYNQEPGVVQHISTVLFDRTVTSWLYALTDEWPMGGQRHQLSVTIPLEHSDASSLAAFGDIALNYRLQLVGSGATRFALTPRLTAILPTGADDVSGGVLALQGAVASSYVASPRIVLHTNAGATITPSAKAVAGETAQLVDFVAGQSAIWLVHPRVNLLVESVLTSTQRFSGVGTDRERVTGITISPGMRWSHDFASGLQIVPGVAFPLGFQANSGQRGVFLYLSFEHPMPGLKK